MFGWLWLVAAADLLWEKITAGWLVAGAYAVWCERKILLASAGAASRTEEVFQEIVVSMNYMKILKRLPHKGRTNNYYLSTYLHYHIIQ